MQKHEKTSFFGQKGLKSHENEVFKHGVLRWRGTGTSKVLFWGRGKKRHFSWEGVPEGSGLMTWDGLK
jgi:hypothetical protein